MQHLLFAVTLGLLALCGHGAADGKMGNDTRLVPPIDEGGPCDCLRWTPWINADQSSDGGDFETIGYNVRDEGGRAGRVTRLLARKGIVCNTPARVECREARTRRHWWLTGDNTVSPSRINCDTDDGFICHDSRQADGRCHDYEIRLLCWTACDQLRWGRWLDKDNPSGSCDCEHPGWNGNPNPLAPACPDGGTPMEVDCQMLSGTPAALGPDKAVTCSVNDGFSCWNSAQGGGQCSDYRVRYLCGDPSQ